MVRGSARPIHYYYRPLASAGRVSRFLIPDVSQCADFYYFRHTQSAQRAAAILLANDDAPPRITTTPGGASRRAHFVSRARHAAKAKLLYQRAPFAAP